MEYLRQRISIVMKWVVAQGYRTDNPADSALNAALTAVPISLSGAAN